MRASNLRSNFNWKVSTCSIVYFNAVIRSDFLVLLLVHHYGRLKHCKLVERWLLSYTTMTDCNLQACIPITFPRFHYSSQCTNCIVHCDWLNTRDALIGSFTRSITVSPLTYWALCYFICSSLKIKQDKKESRLLYLLIIRASLNRTKHLQLKPLWHFGNLSSSLFASTRSSTLHSAAFGDKCCNLIR